MIKILQVRNIDSFVESRRQKTSEKDRKTVQSILNDVRKNGDSAVKKYERKFNGRKTSQLRVSRGEEMRVQSKLTIGEIKAIDGVAFSLEDREFNFFRFLDSVTEEMNAPEMIEKVGVWHEKSFVPIPSVGCYIPGGQARYPSSVAMSVTPAKIAGVKRIVVVSPPGRDGKIDPLTIAAAKK